MRWFLPSSRNAAIEVERLDPKPLNVRATDPKRVEVNSLHLFPSHSNAEQGNGATLDGLETSSVDRRFQETGVLLAGTE